MKHVALVLTTVNAPYKEHLDGKVLALCLKDESVAKAYPGHVSSFFGEVDPEDQVEFAASAGVSKSALVQAAKAFAAYSGQDYPLAK